MSPFSPEEDNYVRMCLLLTGISPRAARIFFDGEFAPACLYASLKKYYNNLFDLKKKHKIYQSQWNLLFPKHPDVPDSKTFDITLMITLLRNLTPITHPHGGYDCLPSAMETTPGADLARIKYYRNYLAHLDDGKVGTTDFNTAWDIVSGAIKRLGGKQMKEECDQLRTKTLDQTNKEIMMNIKRSNEEITDLKESLDSLKRSNDVLQCDHVEIKRSHEVLKKAHTEMKRSHEVLQDDHTEMATEVKRLKTIHDDVVPWNIRGKH
ncbi:unnamed protein product [Mytilus coruscus]|uniref:DZIP3-like HEPN domain-containing protein n=2 Tax=Mytilus coruscus TaxID=42192 RepID=A0A6J8DIK9_MYTCO|nr:unnamed protein product [Mytilus coruscus]